MNKNKKNVFLLVLAFGLLAPFAVPFLVKAETYYTRRSVIVRIVEDGNNYDTFIDLDRVSPTPTPTPTPSTSPTPKWSCWDYIKAAWYYPTYPGPCPSATPKPSVTPTATPSPTTPSPTPSR